MSVWILKLIRDRDCKTDAERFAMDKAIALMEKAEKNERGTGVHYETRGNHNALEALEEQEINNSNQELNNSNQELNNSTATDCISRQAAIDAIRNSVFAGTPTQIDTKIDCIESVKEVPSGQRWIPCSERLPEPGEYYLVTKQYFGWNCTEYREIDIAKYDFDGWHKADTVLAWCELPKPWEGGQNDRFNQQTGGN